MLDDEIIELIAASNVDDKESFELYLREIDQIFRESFCFNDKEIKKHICDIVYKEDVIVAASLHKVFERFVAIGGDTTNAKQRRGLAKTAVKNALELYLKENKKITEGFFEVIEEAKAFNVDLYRLATKTNFKTASKEKMYKTLKALVEEEYKVKNSEETFKLFDIEELQELFLRSANIICDCNKQNIQRVLDLLSDFFYDKQTQKFVLSPKEAVRQVTTFLNMPADKLRKNIEKLKQAFVPHLYSEIELAQEIKKSPSILQVDFAQINKLENSIAQSIQGLIVESGLDYPVDYALTTAHTYCYNLKNINTLVKVNSLSKLKMSELGKVYAARFGAKNAINICMTNFNFLTEDPEIMDCLLCRLAKEKGSAALKYLLQNPAKLKALKEEGAEFGGIRSSRGREDLAQLDDAMPKIEFGAYEESVKKLTSHEKKEMEGKFKRIIDAMKDEENAGNETPPVKDDGASISQDEINKNKEKIINAFKARKIKQYSSLYEEIMDRAATAYFAVKGEEIIDNVSEKIALYKKVKELVDFSIDDIVEIKKLNDEILSEFNSLLEGEQHFITKRSRHRVSLLQSKVKKLIEKASSKPLPEKLLRSLNLPSDKAEIEEEFAVYIDICVKKLKTDLPGLVELILPNGILEAYLNESSTNAYIAYIARITLDNIVDSVADIGGKVFDYTAQYFKNTPDPIEDASLDTINALANVYYKVKEEITDAWPDHFNYDLKYCSEGVWYNWNGRVAFFPCEIEEEKLGLLIDKQEIPKDLVILDYSNRQAIEVYYEDMEEYAKENNIDLPWETSNHKGGEGDQG